MRKICLILLFVLMKVMPVSAASWPIDMYKVSCLPNLKEFRAEVLKVIWSDDDTWEKQVAENNLYVLNKHYQDAPSPVQREEKCLIDGVTYKMKFFPKNERMFEGSYGMAVQLFAEDKYLGMLYPFGYKDGDSFEKFGIYEDNIVVEGCTTAGADVNGCVYKQWKVLSDLQASYEFALLPEEKAILPKFNAVELQCFMNMKNSFGAVKFHNYSKLSELPENYYFLEDNPVLKCGIFEFDFQGDVIHIKQGEKQQDLSLNNDEQIISLEFVPNDEDISVKIFSFDKKKGYWRGR